MIQIQTQTKINPQAWIRYRIVGYMVGKGISYGLGGDLFPKQAIAPSKFSLNIDLLPHPTVNICGDEFDCLANDAFDHVIVGQRLEVAENPQDIIKRLTNKLKLNGHLILVLPKMSNDDRVRWKFNTDSLNDLVRWGSWKIKAQYDRQDHLVWVLKKVLGRQGLVPQTPKPTKPSVCIVRYGALGDMVILSPLIEKFKQDGYHVTMNVTPYSVAILDNNPNVDNIIIQEREAIPNGELGPYWDEWRPEYDKYINLSESLEGALLKVEGRRDFFTTQAWRHEQCNKNYYDHTMTLGGYAECVGTRGKLYFSKSEIWDAQKFRSQHKNKFIVMWSLNGSSHHKIYPLMEPVLRDFLAQHPDALCMTIGDKMATMLEFDHPQVMKTAGQWPLRKVLATLSLVDCVVGPESLHTNTAGCFDVPKITLLSHSTHENLCKHFTNDYCLSPQNTPCWPCHQLHYTMESCPLAEIHDANTDAVIAKGPTCAMGGISGERVLDRLNEVYTKHFKEQ